MNHVGLAFKPQNPALRVEGIRKTFGATVALDDVSFAVARGTVHALLGGNGSGKSTLIKVVAGVQAADAGTLFFNGTSYPAPSFSPNVARGEKLHFVHQQSTVFPELSVEDNLAIGRGYQCGFAKRIERDVLRARTIELLERFEIDARPETMARDLRPAQQTTLSIARALQDQEDADEGILFLDEPTACLPPHEVAMLLDAIKSYARRGQTIVMVTHRIGEILSVADDATVIGNGRVRGHFSRAEMSHDGLVEAIAGRRVESIRTVERRQAGARPVLVVEGLKAGRLKGCSFRVNAGEIVGIAGLLGSGRSSLLQAIFGLRAANRGRLFIDDKEEALSNTRALMRAGLAYVPEDRTFEGVFSGMSVSDNMSIADISKYWSGACLRLGAEKFDSKVLVDRYGVKAADVRTPIGTLSGGNQQKVMIARWLRRSPKVLMLDEPTQGVDIGSRAEIHEVVRAATDGGMGALVVSSDFEELIALCDRILILRNGRLYDIDDSMTIDPETLLRLTYDRQGADSMGSCAE